jgi:hypothetical protein
MHSEVLAPFMKRGEHDEHARYIICPHGFSHTLTWLISHSLLLPQLTTPTAYYSHSLLLPQPTMSVEVSSHVSPKYEKEAA